MVVLTVVTHSNPHTVYFDQPIPQPNYIRLLSCSCWYNLKKEGEIALFDDNTENAATIIKFLPGHYTLESLAKELESSLKKYNVKLPTETYSAVGQMVISNPSNKNVKFDSDLAALLGIRRKLLLKTFVKRLNCPTTYFIHCDLVDKEQNLFNGKPSSVLACYDIRGKAYEKINYKSSQLNVLRDVSAEKHVKSMTLSTRDEMGNLFNFNGTNLTYEMMWHICAYLLWIHWTAVTRFVFIMFALFYTHTHRR